MSILPESKLYGFSENDLIMVIYEKITYFTTVFNQLFRETYLKLHNCFAYFIHTINSWRMVFYFTAPVTELLRIKFVVF